MSLRTLSSPIRCSTSRFTHGRLPLRTVSSCGWYSARHASASSGGSPKRSASRMIDVRQSTHVPNTSNSSARMPYPY